MEARPLRRRTIATDPAPHTETDPSADDAAGTTDALATVDCPECGEPSSQQRIVSWGHCRACRTADSRTKSPLRW